VDVLELRLDVNSGYDPCHGALGSDLEMEGVLTLHPC
jgi:hypothetical protein